MMTIRKQISDLYSLIGLIAVVVTSSKLPACPTLYVPIPLLTYPLNKGWDGMLGLPTTGIAVRCPLRCVHSETEI